MIIPGTEGGAAVTAVASSAFLSNTSVTSVTVPSSVVMIGSNAFKGCSGLAAAYFSGSPPALGSSAFANTASGFTVYSFNNSGFSEPIWNGYASANLSYTTASGTATITGYSGPAGAIILPASINGEPVGAIGANAFEECRVTSVTMPATINSIGTEAFYQCTDLSAVTLSSSLTTIQPYAFEICWNLRKAAIPSTVTNIGQDAFWECAITSATIPAALTSLGSGVFRDCENLPSISVSAQNPAYTGSNGVVYSKDGTTLVAYPPGNTASTYSIPNSVTTLGEEAFEGCGYLTSLNVPGTVTSVEDYAFIDCTGLTSVTFGEGVTSLGSSVFSNCPSLASVSLPSTLGSIGAYEFFLCNNLTNLTISAQNQNFSARQCVIYDKAGDTLLLYAYGPGGNFTVPNGVTTIGNGAFEESFTLTGITFPDSVTTIGSLMCYGCPYLSSLSFGNGLQSIGVFAFQYCPELTTVILPASLTSIGDSAFANCGALNTAVFLGNAPTADDTVFSAAAGGFTVYYFDGATGFSTPMWNGFASVDMGAYSPVPVWLLENNFAYNAGLSMPNGDGVSLAMDYALNLNPTQNESAALPAVTISGTAMNMQYYASSSGVTYTVETSTDLVNWSSSGVTVSGTDANGMAKASALLNGSVMFMRLRVTY
jgi:hypothetical protein